MISHDEVENLGALIRARKIQMAGHAPLKIYGKLTCRSGMRMKKANRVFFESEAEALREGFRPCGNCMRQAYFRWRELVSPAGLEPTSSG